MTTAGGGATLGAPAIGRNDDDVIEESRARDSRRLETRDLRASFLIAGAFLGAAILMVVLLQGGGRGSPLSVVALVAAYALTSRVQFEVGTGLALATQIVLVPMLFALPVGAVPLLVAAGLLLGHLPDLVRRRMPLDRSLFFLIGGWHAVGPALVLGLAAPGPPTWRHAPVYVGALASQFALDFASSAARDRLGLGVAPLSHLRFMGWAFLVDAALAPVGLAFAIAGHGRSYSLVAALPLVGLLAFFARERQARLDHALELSSAYRGTALLLGDVIEADDAYTGSHSRDVLSLVAGVADELGLPGSERRLAEFTALLHDVGKIRVPREIIDKPAKLTPEERRIIEAHTIEGERLLGQIGGLLGEVGRIVRSCHENVDGSGYPDGLSGEQIPIVARIVSCCDAFSAMTTDRSYRPARSAAQAVAELRRCAGTQFDPEVVDALCRVLRR